MIFYRKKKWFGLSKDTGDCLGISRKARMLELFGIMTLEQAVLCLRHLIEMSGDDHDLDQSKFLDVLQEFTTYSDKNVRFKPNT